MFGMTLLKSMAKSVLKSQQNTASCKTPNANGVTIIEDIEKDAQTVQDTRILLTKHPETTLIGNGVRNSATNDVNGHVPATNGGIEFRRKDSLTVPGTVAVSSAANDETVRIGLDSLKLSRETSKLSMLSIDSKRLQDSRIQQAMLEMQMKIEDEQTKQEFSHEDSRIRTAIPYLPLWMSVVCLVMNIIVPGSGTVLSGFGIVCGANSRMPSRKADALMVTFCINTCVGVAQLLTVTFVLVGWFWSLAWGVRMVQLSMERKRQVKEERARQLKKMALSAFGTTAPPRRT